MSGIPDFLRAVSCPALRAAYRYSLSHLAQLERCFAARADALCGVETVAVGGSLGRLEAAADSDADYIIVLRDGLAPAELEAQVAIVHDLFLSAPFKAPKADGIYRHGIARATLLDPAALGSLSESPEIFGKRIALLLDARPVFGSGRFHALQGAVIEWYGSDFLAASPSRAWTYLSNDLMRYLHSYAGWQQYKFTRTVDDSWQLRQAKFRTSRLLSFAALMFLLGESDRDVHKMAWLHQRLALTPLQRLFDVMRIYDATAYGAMLEAYETCYAAFSDSRVRATLVATGPDADTRMNAPLAPAYQDIKAASSVLSQLLTEFALARRAAWGARFFERWLF